MDKRVPRFIPAAYQAPLPLDRLLVPVGAPGAGDQMELDVAVVGAGPAGLSLAIELARLCKQAGREISIGVLEKAGALGEHCLSGAIVNPRAFRELFTEDETAFPFRSPVRKEAVYVLTAGRALRLPTPPSMRNHGNVIASVCEIVRWLGEKAENLGVNIFTGYPAASLLVKEAAVRGVRTVPSGLQRDGTPGSGYSAPTDLVARVTALAEGSRGMLARAWLEWQHIGSANPQIYALGVKEIWETQRPLDRIVHTLGWPLPGDTFGGSFMYPLERNLVALGLVVGLDYPDAGLDIQMLFQRMKRHRLFRESLDGGEMLEWGAKTIPEGGFYSVPTRRSGAGVVLIGDSAGFVDVPSLKGIHYAMQSGIFAARAIFQALSEDGADAERLAEYDRVVNSSFIMHDLHRTRNMRLGFKSGFVIGGLKAAVGTLTRGRLPGKKIDVEADAAVPRRPGAAPQAFVPDGKLTFSKVDAVFKSGNTTRDTIPEHVIVGTGVDRQVAEFYSRVCPAGVYESGDSGLRVNAPNCVDCKATDVLGPTWLPREGGSGPKYKRM